MKGDPADFIRRLFAPVRGPGVPGVAREGMLLSVIPPRFIAPLLVAVYPSCPVLAT